ncbi:hypothetical protein [Terrarubrum flagellatum]|uniref:hypothetical protein n=1 Tax=Terrirubrum flagellatum TaxID=2895980 RepID=UPI00314517DB
MGLKIDARIDRPADLASISKLLGGPAMQAAGARALTEHSEQQEKRSAAFISGFTGVPIGRIRGVMKVRPAAPGAVMESAVELKDAAIPLGEFTYRSWSRSMPGATHGDWPGSGKRTLPGTFSVPRYGGMIYRRATSKRFPIVKVWGPVLPNELAKKERPNYPLAEAFAAQDLAPRVIRHIMSAMGA